MQLGKFGQKMAVAKYPASHGNASHTETFIGVFCFEIFFKSETYDESMFAWFLGGQVLNASIPDVM